jgi:hypothetical protein
MTAAKPASKIKIMLIPVLLGIFAWVVWTNFFPKKDTVQPLELMTVGSNTDASIVAWPLNQFETAIANNPFQPIGQFADLPENTSTDGSESIASDNPTATPSANPPETIPAVEELDSESMTLLIKKGNRSVAVFGEQIIETGQTLRDGKKVESINVDGVISTSTNATDSQKH